MLSLFSRPNWNCQTGPRREFLLNVGSLAGLGVSLDLALRAKGVLAAPRSDMNCILIWTQGGTSHIDSIDPKPDANRDIRGEFDVISTAVPGIQFSELMPNFAKRLGTFAVLRNLNPQNGSHSVADAIMLSGKPFSPTTTYPCFGSVVAKERGKRNSLPPFIQVGTYVDRRARGGLAGYLGMQYNAFELPGDPNDDLPVGSPPRGWTVESGPCNCSILCHAKPNSMPVRSRRRMRSTEMPLKSSHRRRPRRHLICRTRNRKCETRMAVTI